MAGSAPRPAGSGLDPKGAHPLGQMLGTFALLLRPGDLASVFSAMGWPSLSG
jgi:hypothetical protein